MPEARSIKNKLGKLVATLFYIGFSKFAPGTVGSFATLVLSLPIFYFFGLSGLLVSFVLSIILGFWSTEIYMGDIKKSDPQEVVIDEFSGQTLAMIIPAFFFKSFLSNPTLIWIFFISSFVFFRIFDISKIFPVNYFDAMDNPFGVMMDDIMAGILAGLSCCGLLAIIKKFDLFASLPFLSQ